MREDQQIENIDVRHRKRKQWIISILVIVAFIVGGTAFMIEKHNEEQKQEHEYMVKVVKSDEAKAIFEKEIKDIDPNAFTDKGVIKEYSVDYKTLTHNPMGGIDVTLYINNSSKLTASMNLDKFGGNNSLESGGMDLSPQLVKLTNN